MAIGRTSVALLAVLLASTPLTAHAWGAQGHRVIALVADDLLDARTRAAVHELAGQESLADLATWMDEERFRLAHALPGSSKWHYDDIPVCGDAVDPCPQGNCASHAIERYRAILANSAADPSERLLALRILVHLVGDVHQPLHAADDDDRGGNEVAVTFLRGKGEDHVRQAHGQQHGHGRSLHSVWDVDWVHRAAGGESDAEFAADLIAEHSRDLKHLESGSFQLWIGESHALASAVAYGHLPGFACGQRHPERVTLPLSYQEESVQIVRERLATAGIRLAVVLRAALGGH